MRRDCRQTELLFSRRRSNNPDRHARWEEIMSSPHRIAMLLFALLFASLSAFAADYPEPKQGDWVARDFRFHTGEVFAELKLHYRTIGAPTGEPVLVLHGTRSEERRVGKECRSRWS